MQTKKYLKWLITTETQCFPSLRPCLQSVYIEVMTAFPTTFSAAEGVTSHKKYSEKQQEYCETYCLTGYYWKEGNLLSTTKYIH